MSEAKKKSVFDTLNAINCNEHTEKKNGLTYLSWAWAWSEVKKSYPTATYTIYENADGWNYFTDGRTCWVKTGVTIEGLEHIEYLPVMDFRNQSIPKDKVTSFDVNKAIQRSLTKACARHGLGMYIYAGEDLPEGEEEQPKQSPSIPKQVKAQPKPNKGLEVWHKFKEICDPMMSDDEIKQGFARLMVAVTNKTRSTDVTDAEWDAMLKSINTANRKAA